MRNLIQPWMLIALIVVWAMAIETIIYCGDIGSSLWDLILK